MSWFTTNLIGTFLLPPFNLLLTALLGWALTHRHPRLGKPLLVASFLMLWICATPYFSDSALHLLEGEPKVLDTRSHPADAIVVLGGGTYFYAAEYGGDTVSEETLARLRYGATLQRTSGQPILVSGGRPLGNKLSEAQQMESVLEKEFNTPAQWTEDSSNNTLESARHTYQVLQQARITRIYLVTHASHMPRAARSFRAAGFEVVNAPTAFTTRYQTDLLSFLPRAKSLHDSSIFMHEIIGLLWYRLKS